LQISSRGHGMIRNRQTRDADVNRYYMLIINLLELDYKCQSQDTERLEMSIM
jgi:hypothetical protein